MEKINYPKLKKVSYAEEQEVKKNSILYNNTKKFNRVITQYLTIQEYASFKDNKGLGIENSAVAFRDLIHNYQLKVSKKSKKPTKNSVKEKAIVDLMDSLRQFADDGLDKSVNPKGFVAYGNYDSVVVTVPYYGNICLPFKDCLIYSNLGDVTFIMVDIKDLENGFYRGKFYTVIAGDRLCQYCFCIGREDNHWTIVIEMPKRLKPLGQDLCNIGVVLCSLSALPEDHFDNLYKMGRGNIVAAYMAEDAKTLIALLSSLSSYKSKNLYELKGESSYYLYSSSPEQVDEHIKTYYPKCDYKKVEGWIIDGYYKFLPEKEFGKDRNGKRLKGLDWVIPYKNDYTEEQKQLAVSNSQTATIIPIHAIERAKERYNLDLTTDDLNNIANEILAGRDIKKLTVKDKFGRLYTSKNELGCYRLKYKNKYLDVVLSRCTDKDSYRVATFLPAPTDIKSPIIDSKDYKSVMDDCTS